MNSSKTMSYDNLYKVLKIYDKRFYKQFDNLELSDESYFLIAIKSELVSHSLSAVVNLLKKNYLSPGLATNLRAIIEDIAIFRMYESNELSENNYKIFRKMFFFIEESNFRKQKTKDTKLTEEQKKSLKNYKKETLKFIAEILHCKVKDLEKWNSNLDSPVFFLTTNIKKPVKMTKLILEKFDNNICQFYKNLGIQIHANYFPDKIYHGLSDIRNDMFSLIFKDVLSIISSGEKLPSLESEESLENELTKNPLYSDHYKSICNLDCLINYTIFLIEEEGLLNTSFDRFELSQLKSLWIDIRLNLLLGYSEQVVAKFKSFIEIASIYGIIKSLKATEQVYIIEGFQISSLFQENELTNKVLDVNNQIESLDNRLRFIHDSYYKEKYEIAFKKFKEEIINNSLFFLKNKNKKSYSKFVKEFLKIYYGNKTISLNKTYALYKISQDFNHGGGYLFDVTEGISDSSAICILNFIQELFVSVFSDCNAKLNNKKISETIDYLKLYIYCDKLRFIEKTSKW